MISSPRCMRKRRSCPPRLRRETYGAVHPDVKKLFDWLVTTWEEQTQATPSQLAIYRHEWKYRFSMSIQLWNAQALRDGTADAVLADAAY